MVGRCDSQIGRGPLGGRDQFVNSPRLAVNAISVIFVAFTRIRPIENLHASVRAVIQIDAAKPWIFELHEVWLMPGNHPRAEPLEALLIEAPPMVIDREKPVA